MPENQAVPAASEEAARESVVSCRLPCRGYCRGDAGKAPFPDPWPPLIEVYPDVVALRSIAAAVQAAAAEEGLSLPDEAFAPGGYIYGEPPACLRVSILSGMPHRDRLQVSARRARREWSVNGCEGSQRIEGKCTDLAALARAAHAWRRDGTTVADLAQIPPFLAVRTIEYRYLGYFGASDAPDDPSKIIRVWPGENGRQREESFTRALWWEGSDKLTGPDDRDFVAITAATAERFVERMMESVQAEQRSG
jgi:hypothetical protein